MTWRAIPRHWSWVCFFLGAISFLVFLPAVHFGFLNWDDPQNFLENPFYRGFHFANLKWMFTQFHQGVYIPLTWVTLAMDYCVYGMRPAGYHLTSFALHASNAALFALLLQKVFKNNWVVVAAVLAWSVHPLRAESVVWLTQRRDVLSGLFFLLTLWMYSRNRLGWAMSFYACCLLSKATAVTLPIILIVLEWPVIRWRQVAPFVLLAVSVACVTLFGQRSAGLAAPLSVYHWPDRANMFFSNSFFYFEKTVFPVGLSPYYELVGPRQLWHWPAYLSIAGSLLISVFAWLQRTHRPWVWKVWLSYLLLVAPVSGLFQNGGQLAADRYSYLPGLCLSVGFGFSLSEGSVSKSRKIVVGTVLLFLLMVTQRQIRFWSSFEAFVQRILVVDPGSSMGNNNWGALLASQGRVKEALPYFERAVERNPGNDNARLNRDRALALVHRRK
jgi:hypothetical protein